MKKLPVIHQKYIPPKLPIQSSVLWFLLIEVNNIQGAWLGVICTFMTIVWCAAIYAVFFYTEKFDPIFRGELTQTQGDRK